VSSLQGGVSGLRSDVPLCSVAETAVQGTAACRMMAWMLTHIAMDVASCLECAHPEGPRADSATAAPVLFRCCIHHCAAAEHNYCVTSQHLAKVMAMTVSSSFAGTVTGKARYSVMLGSISLYPTGLEQL
jgi:hypothetical protein